MPNPYLRPNTPPLLTTFPRPLSAQPSTPRRISTAEHLLHPIRARTLSATPISAARRRTSSWNPASDRGIVGDGGSPPASPRPRVPRGSVRSRQVSSNLSVEQKEERYLHSKSSSKTPSWETVFDNPSTASAPGEPISILLSSIISNAQPFFAYPFQLPSSCPPSSMAMFDDWRPSALLRHLRDSMLENGLGGTISSTNSLIDQDGMLRLSFEEVEDAIRIEEGIEFLLSLPPSDTPSNLLAYPSDPISSAPSGDSTIFPAEHHKFDPNLPPSKPEFLDHEQTRRSQARSRAIVELETWSSQFLKGGGRWDLILEWVESYLTDSTLATNGDGYSSSGAEQQPNTSTITSGSTSSTVSGLGQPSTFLLTTHDHDDDELVQPPTSHNADLPPIPDLSTLLILTSILSSLRLFRHLLSQALECRDLQDALLQATRLGENCERGLGDVEDEIAHSMEDGMDAMRFGDGVDLGRMVREVKEVVLNKLEVVGAGMRELESVMRILHALDSTGTFSEEQRSALQHVWHRYLSLQAEIQLYSFFEKSGGTRSLVDKMQEALENMGIFHHKRERMQYIREQADILLDHHSAVSPENALHPLANHLDELLVPPPSTLFESGFTRDRWDVDLGCGFVQAEAEYQAERSLAEQERADVIKLLEGYQNRAMRYPAGEDPKVTPNRQRGISVTLESPDSNRSPTTTDGGPDNRDSMTSITSTDYGMTMLGDGDDLAVRARVQNDASEMERSRSPPAEKMVHSGLDKAIRRMAATAGKPGLTSVQIKPIARPQISNNSVSALYRFTCGGRSDQRMCRVLGESDTVMVRTGGGYENLIKWINQHFENEMNRAGMSPLPMDTPPSQIIGNVRGSSTTPGDAGASTSSPRIGSLGMDSPTPTLSFSISAGGPGSLPRSRTNSTVRHQRSITSSPTSSTSYFTHTPFPRSSDADGLPRTISPVMAMRSGSESPTVMVRQTNPSGSLGASSGLGLSLGKSSAARSRRSISIEGSPLMRSASMSATTPPNNGSGSPEARSLTRSIGRKLQRSGSLRMPVNEEETAAGKNGE